MSHIEILESKILVVIGHIKYGPFPNVTEAFQFLIMKADDGPIRKFFDDEEKP